MDPVAHASIGMAAKYFAPKLPFWAMVTATQVPDLLSFAFMATGVEHGAVTQLDLEHGLQYLSPASIAWSHGLAMCLVWSLVVAAVTFALYRDRWTSLVVGLMVMSHWALDCLVYPNMPLGLEDTPMIGLGLITSGPGLIAGILLEISLVGGGITALVATIRRNRARARSA